MALGRLARTVLAGALACLLSACWMSDEPLITDGNASSVDFIAHYRGKSGDDPLDVAIVSDGAKSYALANETDERVPVHFLALRGDWYLMQAESHSDEEGTSNFYLYQLVRPVNGDLYFYSPACEDVPGKFKGLKRETTIEVAEGDTAPLTCNFSRVEGLKALALAAVARIEKGELADEPNILTRVAAP